MESYFHQIADALSSALNNLGVKVAPHDLETPPDRTMGDIAFPCFKLAKAEKKAPQQIAANLAKQLSGQAGLEKVTVSASGPYVNFTIPANNAWTDFVEEIHKNPNFGARNEKSRGTWVWEYSSPNVAKPFQIYHLRVTIVGSTLAKISKYRGYNTVRINHLGDWGTQYGKLAVGLKKYASTLPAVWTLHDLVRIYVQIHKDMETDPQIEVEGQAAFRRLEQGDPDMIAVWKKCIETSLQSFHEVYKMFDVEFDHFWGESFYQKQLAPLLEDLKKRKILVQSEGAWVVPVTTRDGHEIPPCILEKSDGATIYATRDIAAALYRQQQFHFDRMSYVVGKEQLFHFEQIFGVLRAMGCEWESRCEHIATGTYRFQGAKMSTRKGNFVTLEEVLTLCREKSLELIQSREQTAQDSNESRLDQQLIAEQVAIGALVFADLSTDPNKDLEFDLERMISFEGETGPYLQYAYTRCNSILRKSGLQNFAQVNWKQCANLASSPTEILLIKQLGRFPLILERVLELRKPSQLTTYLVDLVKDFNAFYRDCKVIQEDQPDLTLARLAIVHAAKEILGKGLGFLGMPKPERM